jgi:hypothetical protein
MELPALVSMIVISQWWVIVKREQSVGYLLNLSAQSGCPSNDEKCLRSVFEKD